LFSCIQSTFSQRAFKIIIIMSGLLKIARMFFQSNRSLQWHPVSSTAFQRNIDALEGFHALSGSHQVPVGRRRRDITVSVKLQERSGEKKTAAQVRTAWLAIRRKHPAMASVLQDTKRLYNKADIEELQNWLDETFLTIANDDGLTPELLDGLEATSRPTLYFLEKTHTFALRTPHHTLDGVGAFYLLNDTLKELGKATSEKICPPFYEQPADLSCCLREATKSAFPSLRQLLRLLKIRRTWLQSYPSVRIVPDQISCHTGVSSWTDLQLSEPQTRDLLMQAKKHGLTLTHACHAALVIGAKNHGGFPEDSNYSSVIVMNMRGHGADSSMLERNIASLQHVIWPINLSVTNFLSTARCMKQLYLDAAQSDDLLPLAESIFLEGMRTTTTSDHFHSAPFITSFGKFENFIASSYGSLQVEDVSLMVECSREDIVVGVWSYKGKLTLRVMYNKGFYSERSIKRYLCLTKVALLEGLGVGL
jgi:hypothetical protein